MFAVFHVERGSGGFARASSLVDGERDRRRPAPIDVSVGGTFHVKRERRRDSVTSVVFHVKRVDPAVLLGRLRDGDPSGVGDQLPRLVRRDAVQDQEAGGQERRAADARPAVDDDVRSPAQALQEVRQRRCDLLAVGYADPAASAAALSSVRPSSVCSRGVSAETRTSVPRARSFAISAANLVPPAGRGMVLTRPGKSCRTR